MYLILNYKTYPEATNSRAVALTQLVAEMQTQSEIDIVVCPQLIDTALLHKEFPNVQFWAQHIDPLPAGQNTGWIVPENLKYAGIQGSLVNHSEHNIQEDMIGHTIETLALLQMASCICVPDMPKFDRIMSNPEATPMPPTFIAYEPPELIGGENSPLDDPKHLELAVQAIESIQQYDTIPLLGAGVRDAQDVQKSIQLGYKGVLLASGFAKSDDPKQFLTEILSAFER